MKFKHRLWFLNYLQGVIGVATAVIYVKKQDIFLSILFFMFACLVACIFTNKWVMEHRADIEVEQNDGKF